jgi:hypothetical protein
MVKIFHDFCESVPVLQLIPKSVPVLQKSGIEVVPDSDGFGRESDSDGFQDPKYGMRQPSSGVLSATHRTHNAQPNARLRLCADVSVATTSHTQR